MQQKKQPSIFLSIKTFLGIGLLWLMACEMAIGQVTSSNLRQQLIQVQFPEQVLDSLTIIPHTFQLKNTETNTNIDTAWYELVNNRLVWNTEVTYTITDFTKQSLEATYRVFPYQFAARIKHLDTLKMERTALNADDIAFDYSPYEESQTGLLDEPNLDYQGSFSRGISLGNNQSVVLNSNFNLQMAGTVGDVEILAAISDSNIPLQPEGNTQQLQDFDKVFIQVKKDQHQLTAGDYEISNSENYFLRYYKKLQGATYENKTKFSDTKSLNTQASIAIARGKFARNTLVVQEGNQGPYRLQGNEGERFIILLAGTERVYVDGQLKKRGIEYDYIIDYNRGDITFTANQLITKDRRVIVEFEYSDQNFLRTLYAVQSDYTTDKMRLYFNLFSQQDSKNTAGLTELTANDKQVLATVGDQVNQALVTGIRPLDTENANPISYHLLDTLVNGIVYDSVLVYIPNMEGPYTARFTEVGEGQGNYIRDVSAANGTIFLWVEPDMFGHPQGNHAPIIQLLAPVSHQIYSLGLDYQLSSKSSIQTELALSNENLNRFSKLDSADDIGLAAFTNYRFRTPLSKDSLWSLTTDIRYEYKQQYFRALNPYRQQEFNRDWNIGTLSNSADEHLGKASLRLERRDWGSANYEYSTFLNGNLYTGNRHFTQIDLQKKGFRFFAEGNLLETATDLETSRFSRPKFDVSQTFGKNKAFKIGTYAERERNERMQGDTLTATSFYYDFLKFYIENQNAKTITWEAFFSQRWDYHPFGKTFEQVTKANNIGFKGDWKQSRFSKLAWNFTYRQLDINRPDLTTEDPLETYLGKLDYQVALWKGAVKSTTTYTIGAGQEPRLDYNYLMVNPGEGSYQWNDYNEDDVQQVNEFEIAVNPDQAQYIRVAILTNEFIRSNNIGFNESLSLNPRAIWHQKKGKGYAFLNKFSSQSIFKINRKTRTSPEVQLWNPFQTALVDTSLVATTSGIRNTLFFNRTNPKYDFQVGQIATENRLVLTTGFESRATREQFFRARWNLWKPLTLITYISQGNRRTDSQFFNERDYDIAFQKIELSAVSQFKSDWSATFQYLWQTKANILTNLEQATQNEFSIKMNYQQSAKTSLQVAMAYANVAYQGENNTAVAFALLERLQPGRNYRWEISLDRQIAKNMQLNIGYEGRQTGTLNVVHIGRMQLRALF